MKLELIRKEFTDNSTIGDLFIDGVFFCYTLEDKVRDVKVYGETAIPTGTYKVELTISARFKKVLPLLINVPNYAGVRIHPGNTKDHTEGCVLLGLVKDVDFVGMSRVAVQRLLSKLQGQKNITITIR